MMAPDGLFTREEINDCRKINGLAEIKPREWTCKRCNKEMKHLWKPGPRLCQKCKMAERTMLFKFGLGGIYEV